jgi:crossover junction endodeoxyribonuclease RuvC
VSIVLGIDIGLQGAIAFVDGDTEELLFVQDMPTSRTMVNGKERGRIDRAQLLSCLMSARGAYAFAERPEARPMRQTDKRTGQTTLRQPGAAGMLAFGEGYGCVLMGCTAAGMSLTEIRPGAWKRALSVPAGKDDSIRRAAEIWPALAGKYFTLKKHDGRAESALLALYGVRSIRGRLTDGIALATS